MNIFYVVSCRELCEEQQWFWKLHGWTDIYYLLSISLPCFYPSNNIATSYKITPLQIQYMFVFIYFFKCKLLPQQFRLPLFLSPILPPTVFPNSFQPESLSLEAREFWDPQDISICMLFNLQNLYRCSSR